MVEADAHGELRAEFGAERVEPVVEAPHRAHRIGQHEHFEAAPQRRAHHRQHVGVHERFAAGEADLARAHRGGFVEEGVDFGQRQVDEGIVGRRAFDVTGLARKIAQRPGVDPQRIEPLQHDMGAGIPADGHPGIDELGAIERPRLGNGEGRNLGRGKRRRHTLFPSPTPSSIARRARNSIDRSDSAPDSSCNNPGDRSRPGRRSRRAGPASRRACRAPPGSSC